MSKRRNIGLERVSEMFRVLGNESRLKILLRLASCCDGDRKVADTGVCACVGELGRDLGIVPSTVSHHIKELKQAGLIRIERKGQTVECRLGRDALRELSLFLETKLEGQNNE